MQMRGLKTVDRRADSRRCESRLLTIPPIHGAMRARLRSLHVVLYALGITAQGCHRPVVIPDASIPGTFILTETRRICSDADLPGTVITAEITQYDPRDPTRETMPEHSTATIEMIPAAPGAQGF